MSSQAWKRAIRRDFEGFLDQSDLGVRSLRIVDEIKARIMAADPTLVDSAEELAVGARSPRQVSRSEKNKARKNAESEDFQKTGALLFLSNPQIDALAQLAITSEGKPDRKAAKEVLTKGIQSIWHCSPHDRRLPRTSTSTLLPKSRMRSASTPWFRSSTTSPRSMIAHRRTTPVLA